MVNNSKFILIISYKFELYVEHAVYITIIQYILFRFLDILNESVLTIVGLVPTNFSPFFKDVFGQENNLI